MRFLSPAHTLSVELNSTSVHTSVHLSITEVKVCPNIRKCHAAVKQLQSSPTYRDVVKKRKKCSNLNCQSYTFIKPHGRPWRWGGIPQNESEAVESFQKRFSFALSEVSFLKLSKTVTEYEFITKYSTKLIMNETKFIMFLKLYFPGRSKYKKLLGWKYWPDNNTTNSYGKQKLALSLG